MLVDQDQIKKEEQKELDNLRQFESSKNREVNKRIRKLGVQK